MYGIGYRKILSPVVNTTSVRLLLSLIASHHWQLHLLEIKNVFLHCVLDGKSIDGAATSVCYYGRKRKFVDCRSSLWL